MFPCLSCGKVLGSARAREQHSEMKHPARFPCAACGKVLGSARAREQHTEMKHGEIVNEDYESSDRYSDEGAGEYKSAVRTGPPAADETPLPRGFDPSDGHWVHRDDFPDRLPSFRQAPEISAAQREAFKREHVRNKTKSFGYYWCDACEHPWFSAHAFKYFEQACTECDVYIRPLYMWINDKERERVIERKDDDDPHITELCAACAAGVCSAVRRRRGSAMYL